MRKKVSSPVLEDKIDSFKEDIVNIQCALITSVIVFVLLLPIAFKSNIALVISLVFFVMAVLSKYSTHKTKKKLDKIIEEYNSLNKKHDMIESLYELHELTKNRIPELGKLYIYLIDNFENKCSEKDYSYFYLDDYFFSKVKSYLTLIEILQKKWPKDEKLEDALVDEIAEIETEIEILAKKYYNSIVNLNKKECEIAINMVHKTINAPEALADKGKKVALPPKEEEKKYKESVHEAMTNETLLFIRQCMNW